MPTFELPIEDPWAGYARLEVTITRSRGDDVTVRPAPRGEVGEWPWPSSDPVHVLTAWDPGGERPGPEVNRRRQAHLEEDLHPLAARLWPAVGRDLLTGEQDEGVAVVGVPEPVVLELGARYGQDAVFVWTPDEWAIMACVGGRRAVSGWAAVLSDHYDV